jgi:hypothetical protein
MVKPEEIKPPREMVIAAAFGHLPPDGIMSSATWKIEFDNMEPKIARALAWLANNPIIPSTIQYNKMETEVLTAEELNSGTNLTYGFAIGEWQRRMFIKPSVPQELKLILSNVHEGSSIASEDVTTLVCEAYNAGIESAKRDEQLKRKLKDQIMAQYETPPTPSPLPKLSMNYKGITIQQE